MKINIWYLPSSNGDGSVSVRFFSTEEKLRAYQKAEEEAPWYEGWGEDCSNCLQLEVAEDGTLRGPEGYAGWNFDPVFKR